MFDLKQLSFLTTPIGVSISVGLSIVLYLYLMSFNVYLPAIVLLSTCVGLIVYHSQTNCPVQVPTVCVSKLSDE